MATGKADPLQLHFTRLYDSLLLLLLLLLNGCRLQPPAYGP
jgi:hypothetical protein